MEDYDEKTISDLDTIVSKLKEKGSLQVNEYISELNNNLDYWNALCGILEMNKWIVAHRCEETGVLIIINSESFHTLLLGGNFSQRQRKQKDKDNQTTPIVVNAGNNSNIAIQNTGSVNQNITSSSEIENCLSNIEAELERNNSIQQEDHEDIIELIENIRESLQDHRKPLNSVMKRLQRFGNTIVAIAPYVELLSKYLGAS
ncbi:MAG TPA: hypothetical protein PKA78_14510 [Macellibacteroides fermentans]|uniref:hypothetical protein n=1 Tax=Macellibacteroides fermentans TaxID=879969 RepID=UPI002CDAE5D3|nr:hypothetical protein [Macellibacteroides fermentans]